jgi:glyoxylase-like metal-dependent hydrolase (beta-lactamase superfamily II)
MPQKPLPLIISLKHWREENGFSQSDAVKVLNNTGIPVTLDSLQNWESGRRSPRADVALALADFLRGDPTSICSGSIPAARIFGIARPISAVVALTHAHPDHCWGLVDDHGNRLYPNARVAISAVDYNYWTDLSRIPEASTQHRKNHFSGAYYNLLPYHDSLIFIEDNREVVPGITAIAATGHSPGHYVYAIHILGRTLINIGDLSHHHILLLKRPHWEFQFDYDPIKAAETRIWHFDRIAHERHSVLACHFPFPGLGHLRKDLGGYTWVATPIDLGTKKG